MVDKRPAFSFDLSHDDFDSFFSMNFDELLKEDMEFTYPIQGELTAQNERYTEGEVIGTFGANIIFKVYDSHSGRHVAKVMLSDDVNHDNIEHFLREARLTASLQHPNILPVYDIGIKEYGAPFYIMEWLDCDHLSTIILKVASGDAAYIEKYPRSKMLDIFIKLCYAVEYAHSRDIVHQNLNPSAIFIGDFGEVFIGDWSRAKCFVDDYAEIDEMLEQELAYEGVILPLHGDPGYRAPELIVDSKQGSEGSDQYSLGALLYAMLNNCPPVEGHTSSEIEQNAASGELKKFINTQPQVILQPIQDIVYKSLSHNPNERFETVRKLRKVVTEYIHCKDVMNFLESLWWE